MKSESGFSFAIASQPFKAFMAELSSINVDLKLRLVQCDFEFSSVSRRGRGRKMVYRKRRELVSDSSTNHLL